MPRLSDTMEEGAISTWHKKPGDQVAVGDVLVEIETDKAVMEYEAYQAGTLAEILVPEGQNADIGAPIALLDDGKGLDDGTGGPAPSASAAAAQSPSPERIAQTPAASAASPAAAAPGEAPAVAAAPTANGSANGGRQFASPLVRKLARENHLDLSHVTGSGPGGRIIRADINDLRAGSGSPAPGSPVAPAGPAGAAPAPAPAGRAGPAPGGTATAVERGSRGVPATRARPA